MTDHEALRESAGAYVLGALAAEERSAFEAHLASCAECAAEVRALALVAGALPYAVPQVDPPPALRRRILATIEGRAPSSRPAPDVTRLPAQSTAFGRGGWLSAAAMLVLTVALGSYALSLRERVGGLEEQLSDAMSRLTRSEQQVAEATAIAEGARVRMAVLTAPDLLQVTLAGQSVAPGASGRAFLSRSTGLVFAASDLPALPAGRTYQLWYLQPNHPNGLPPVSAGLVRPDDTGRVATAFDVPANAGTPAGLALSIEPEGGLDQPSGALYLVGLAQ